MFDIWRKIKEEGESTIPVEPSALSALEWCEVGELYDPLTMPPDLRAAHTVNDRAVLAAYGLAPDTPEPEIVAHLFKLYAEMTKKAKQ